MFGSENNTTRAMLSILLFATVIFANTTAASTTVRVVDGDTIEVGNITYRLHGIDAPEVGQKCKSDSGKDWACGKAAVTKMEALVLGANVVCDDLGADDYDRVIGVCRANDEDVNAAMVRTGHAWAFRRYSADYVADEEAARRDRVGVFQAETQTPWDYRAAKWQAGAEKAPDGCPIKGNISDRGRIYHTPWSRSYNRTKINTTRGERWFCSEAEAIQAGWRAPKWGR